jgi:hypothetical protein
MRQGIIPGLSQITGPELTGHVYVRAGDDDDDDNLARQSGAVQESDDE